MTERTRVTSLLVALGLVLLAPAGARATTSPRPAPPSSSADELQPDQKTGRTLETQRTEEPRQHQKSDGEDPEHAARPERGQGQGEQESEEQELPPYPDAVGGFQVSMFGGSVFSGSNALQVGGTLTYFFKPAAWIGFEVEGATTMGPGGRVTHASANLVLQTGARTSNIVPYLTVGGGFVRARLDLPEPTQRELDRLGIVVEPDSESAPSLNYGGGVRYYLREKIAVRGDFRSTLVLRDTDESFFDRLFTVNRLAGMLSIEF